MRKSKELWERMVFWEKWGIVGEKENCGILEYYRKYRNCGREWGIVGEVENFGRERGIVGKIELWEK